MKALKILMPIIILPIILRLAMPYAALRYLEYRLNKTPEYQVKISTIDIHLYRGSCILRDIQLFKMSQKIPEPFFSAKSINFAVEWSVLLHGKFAAKIHIEQPVVNFVTDPKKENKQLSINQEWTHAVKELVSMNFNKITLDDGELHFRNINSKPTFDLYLKDIHAEVDHLVYQDKAAQKDNLLSSLQLHARAMDNAKVNLDIHFDSLAKQATFDLNGQLENLPVKEINDFLRYYTAIEAKQGVLSLYIEAVATHGKIKGYAQPIFKNLIVVEPKKDENAAKKLHEISAKLLAKIFENPETKTVTIRINFSGNIDNPHISL